MTYGLQLQGRTILKWLIGLVLIPMVYNHASSLSVDDFFKLEEAIAKYDFTSSTGHEQNPSTSTLNLDTLHFKPELSSILTSVPLPTYSRVPVMS